MFGEQPGPGNHSIDSALGSERDDVACQISSQRGVGFHRLEQAYIVEARSSETI